jgi:FAD/FMN-containing dehydrogenase
MIIFPQNITEAKEAILNAKTQKKSILPFGQGHSLGKLIDDDNIIALGTKNLNKIVSIEPENLLATVEAGLTAGELNQALQQTGLYWPVTALENRSLGGIMAQGLLGAETMARGNMNDWILGTDMLAANGEYLRSGGRTLKNVSGYDLTRLCWRSRGSLALVVSFIVKLNVRPKYAPVLEYRNFTPQTVPEVLEKIIKQRLRPQSLRFKSEQNDNLLTIWLAGFPEQVELQQQTLTQLLGSPSLIVSDGFEYFATNHQQFMDGAPNSKRWAGSRQSLLLFLQDQPALKDDHYLVDLGNQRLVCVNPSEDLTVTADKSGLYNLTAQVFKTTGPLFRRLKAAVDPENVFLVL